MTGQQKLLSLWAWLLLMAALCSGVHYVPSKRGGTFKARGKSDGPQTAPSQGRGLPKPGLKWAGAAAGILGGTGTGYGLGFLGRHKHGPGSRHSQRAELAQGQGRGFHNQSAWRAFARAAAPVSTSNVFLTLAQTVSILITVWIRDV